MARKGELRHGLAWRGFLWGRGYDREAIAVPSSLLILLMLFVVRKKSDRSVYIGGYGCNGVAEWRRGVALQHGGLVTMEFFLALGGLTLSLYAWKRYTAWEARRDAGRSVGRRVDWLEANGHGDLV